MLHHTHLHMFHNYIILLIYITLLLPPQLMITPSLFFLIMTLTVLYIASISVVFNQIPIHFGIIQVLNKTLQNFFVIFPNFFSYYLYQCLLNSGIGVGFSCVNILLQTYNTLKKQKKEKNLIFFFGKQKKLDILATKEEHNLSIQKEEEQSMSNWLSW